MVMMHNCAECDQPLPQEGHPKILLVEELLDLRDLLTSLDPSATKFGFCDRGVELASLIHVSAHSGEAPKGLARRAKHWRREATKRLDVWRSSKNRSRSRTRTPSLSTSRTTRPFEE